MIKIGITAGDPAGIGPEVAIKAINELSESGIIPILICRSEILNRHYSGLINDFEIIPEKNNKPENAVSGKKYILDIPVKSPMPLPGHGGIETGAESRIYIDKAVDLWKRKIVDAIVTGPVSKAFIEKSGLHFTGHTEYIASLIGEENPYMLMYSEDFRVLLVTIHIKVSDIPQMVTAEKMYKTIVAGNKAMSLIDGGNIKIAVAGLDPHCGDEGAIGNFDMNITGKVVQKAIKDGIIIEGPFAADTLFTPQKWKSYNLAIAHYHDQGLIPFKALAFESGVNVTLGLSIVRTSPDHGTAFDIAGQNKANHKSMLEAIKLAYKLAMQRQSN